MPLPTSTPDETDPGLGDKGMHNLDVGSDLLPTNATPLHMGVVMVMGVVSLVSADLFEGSNEATSTTAHAP